MKANLSEIVYIVDRSGSMYSLTSDVIGGINRFIDEQRSVEGEANFTLVLFDDEVTHIHDRVNIKDVPHLTDETYMVGGSTAMNDAIGLTVKKLGVALAEMDESERPSKVIVCIMTDGQENASREYSTAAIKAMIDHQTEKYAWEFVFMAANIDVDEVSDQIGIRSANRYAFAATSRGVDMACNSLSFATTSYRSDVQ